MRARKLTGEARVLIFDVETLPMLGYFFSPKTEYIPHGQIIEDISLASFAALWRGDPPSKMIYRDVRNKRDLRDHKSVLRELRSLLDEADVVITKNGKRFDQGIVFGMMEHAGIKKPSPFLHEDIEQLFRKHFRLPYYNLEYLSERYCKIYKKSGHHNFPGFKLWLECMFRNPKAWEEMEKYNILDVLSTEELTHVIFPWGTKVNFGALEDGPYKCSCGSIDFQRRGHRNGRYRYQCNVCGSWHTDRKRNKDAPQADKKPL